MFNSCIVLYLTYCTIIVQDRHALIDIDNKCKYICFFSKCKQDVFYFLQKNHKN